MQTKQSRSAKPPIRAFLAAAILVMYWVLVPHINARFGTSLPELRSQSVTSSPVDSDPTDDVPAKRTPADLSEQPPELDGLPIGYLKEIGSQRYQSPAGLVYGPGSQEGHRVRHIARHVQDIPTRPGSHGVFDGGLDQALRVIDEAYEKTAEDSPDVDANQDGNRSIYTVKMRRRVGYVGGQTGKRNGNPDASRIRLVLDGNRLITAFPL